MTQEELLQEELHLEAQAKKEAYNSMLNSLCEAERKGAVDSQSILGKAFFQHKAYALKEAIQTWLEDKIKPKAGVKPNFISILNELQRVYRTKEDESDLNTIANICTVSTLGALLNTLSTAGDDARKYLNNTASYVGYNIEHEYKLKCFDLWLQNLPKEDINRRALGGLDKRVGESYRSYYLKQAMKKCGYVPPAFEMASLRTLCTAFIAIAEEVTGYFTLEHEYKEPESLVPTLQFAEAWQRNEDHILDKARSYKPMVLPPVPWTTIDDGGYYGESADYTSFLRLKYTDTVFGKAYAKKLAQLDISDVYKAVNSIQETPYIINGEVLDVLKECRANGYIPCSSEKSKVISLYPTPPAEPDENASEEAIKAFKREKAAYSKKEKRRISLQNRANSAINIAIKYHKYDKIYFPWNMDFRGRIYPIPLFSPQGDDLTKGLLLFADTPPCQHKDDLKWLAITGANLAGVDKVSYDDRIKWVQEHEEAILASAADPMGYQWWLQQDEPVQMLAFCFEWKKAHEWIAEHGSIVGFVTGLPYAQDGTCSGLQHFSAILRDPIGGKAVNLIPQDKPNDIYAQVAEKVKEFLKEDAMHGTLDEWDEDKLRTKYGSKTLAQIWLNFGINRKVTKRPTMTLAYGAKKVGFTAQILEDTIKKAMREQEETCVFTEANCYQCAQYMAAKIWDAVGQTVVKAIEGMDWLHKCAKLVTKNSNVVSWVTPLGLLLQQSYTKYNIEIVKLRCAGKRFRIYTPHQTGEIDKTRQSNGIAPNFIHSMDACHLQMTVCRAKDAGIDHFAMIHDSYGCPMSQAQLMYDIVRQAFIDMYTDFDVLDMFRECLQPLSNKTLPTPPQRGTLDLNCVKDSKYIFC